MRNVVYGDFRSSFIKEEYYDNIGRLMPTLKLVECHFFYYSEEFSNILFKNHIMH